MVLVGRWPPTRPPSFRVDSAFLSLCSPSPWSSAPPLMNSSAHLLSSTSTLTPTTGAILMEKRSLSKHGEPHRIDLSTSAPSRPLALSLGPSAFQHSASAYSTSCPSRHDTLSTARGGLKNSPPGCPDCMPPYRSLHSGMKLWKCMDDFYVEERGNEIESLDLSTPPD